jgi:hypothetical protein
VPAQVHTIATQRGVTVRGPMLSAIRRGHPQPSLYQSRRARRLDALAFLDHILTTTKH